MHTSGLHHVTAIASDAQTNIDFYAGVLGLRLVKRTVNFDDPGSYHFYFGTELGAPGTILTFFAWPGAFHGAEGTGQVHATALAVPAGSLEWWAARFRNFRVPFRDPARRLGEEVLSFRDRDGLELELVAPAQPDPREPWSGGGVPESCAIRGLHAVSAQEEGYEKTARLLADTLSFSQTASEGNRFRYAADAGGPGEYLDLLCAPDAPPARGGAGTVHHIAWRAADDAVQLAWRQKIADAGRNVSPVLDRQYFRSIYFREPGGVLFEIATDGPGFATDEAPADLGKKLQLPPWLEPMREQIESNLPRIQMP